MTSGPVVLLLGVASMVRSGDTIPVVSPVRIQEPATEPLKLPTADKDIEAATASFRQGKVDEARRQLDAAVARNPALPSTDALLAILYLSANQTQQGRLLLEKAAAEGPDHPDIYLMFGRIALAERRLTDAKLAFEKAAATELPKGLTNEQKTNVAIGSGDGLARVAEARGRWPEARDRLLALLKLQPRNAGARQRLGRAYFQLDQTNEAFEALKQASIDDVNMAPAGVTMGQLFSQKGDAKKAEEWMEYAIRADPKGSKARLGRAAWLIEQGRAEQAQADLEVLAGDGPPTAELRRLRGLLAYSLGDFKAAEEDYQALLQTSPADLQASNQLALCLAAQEDEAKRRRAMELAQVNVRQYPNQPAVLTTLGWVEFKAGRVEQAERTFMAAASKGQISSDAAFQFAQILAARGKVEEARKLVTSAIALPGAFLDRERAKAWLADLPAAKPSTTP